MTRISSCFEKLRSKNRKALIPYVTAGDPTPDITLPLMHAMVKAGADIIELGIPFSDPMADGPIIQRAGERALAQRVNLQQVLAIVAEFRRQDNNTPVILMGYLNPLEVMGYAKFVDAASVAGVDGTIIVDLPPEEAQDFVTLMQARQMATIFLIAPTTDDKRIAKICTAASGFVYYVSLKGTTGAASLDVKAVTERISRIRKATKLPVGVGFGIKDANTAAQIARIADAVIVGSALVKIIESLLDHPQRIIEEISSQITAMRKAMDEINADESVRQQIASK